MNNRETLPEPDDTRTHGPQTGSMRELLDFWVDMYRETLLIKIGGLDAQQLCQASVPPSTLTLIGIVRHLTKVEAYWCRGVFAGEEVPDIYSRKDRPDADFTEGAPETAFADVDAYRAETERSRAAVAGIQDLTTIAQQQRHGEAVNLGWILSHLIEEYARHLGHADLLRESIDGRTGY